jgi:hypothetical protein
VHFDCFPRRAAQDGNLAKPPDAQDFFKKIFAGVGVKEIKVNFE